MTERPAPMTATDGGRLLSHLIRALTEHSLWLRRQGMTAPAEVTALLDVLTAMSGLERPPRDAETFRAEPEPVLLLTETEVARRMSMSPRAVRRLIASGELPSLAIGRARRVHAADLDQHLATKRRSVT